MISQNDISNLKITDFGISKKYINEVENECI